MPRYLFKLTQKHTEENCKMVASGKYQDEIDYLVSSKSRNNFIKNLALKLKGNTLILFQLVEHIIVKLNRQVKKLSH